ncbi:hypothetical protein CIPAW_05G263500 [Carya illinoinensis]|uniref:C2 domain-containing protein n=1 Tax=Carya illinoinensis TaxID=32201 RepID=A0A8T1QMP1_CARIL|nr:hypothetical protein CIPAW_05G263500 [Carya illinoinensis]
MASRYELEIKISSARDLKNINWRHGPIRPYAVLWVDPNNKCSSKVDEEGDTCPHWDETLVLPLPGSIDDYPTLYIDIVHAGSEEETKPLIGSARLKLTEVLDDVGFNERAHRTLQLKRPSGRPHGKIDVNVEIRQPRYRAPDPYHAPSYGVPPPSASRSYDYTAPPPYGNPYAAPPHDPYYSAAPPAGGYPYSGYNAPTPYGQPSYGQTQYGGEYGYGQVEEKKKDSKFGMGTGLAVGAVAGVLGGIAIAEGADYVEDKIADEAAERVEEQLEDDAGRSGWMDAYGS